MSIWTNWIKNWKREDCALSGTVMISIFCEKRKIGKKSYGIGEHLAGKEAVSESQRKQNRHRVSE